jgi:hypothetical protein
MQVRVLCTDLDSNEQISQDGRFTVDAGQQISCEVVNEEIPPSITLIKEVAKDNGGMAEKSDFTLTINGLAVPQETPVHRHHGQ